MEEKKLENLIINEEELEEVSGGEVEQLNIGKIRLCPRCMYPYSPIAGYHVTSSWGTQGSKQHRFLEGPLCLRCAQKYVDSEIADHYTFVEWIYAD